MYDKELVQDILNQILDATQKVITRFTPIQTAEDFTISPENMEKPYSSSIRGNNKNYY